MIQHIEKGFTVNLAMDGIQTVTHSEHQRNTMPLELNYDTWISGSIAGMLEACDLANIDTLQHGEDPPTHKQGSRKINFMFIFPRLVEHVEAC
jgi:hypothetical protein